MALWQHKAEESESGAPNRVRGHTTLGQVVRKAWPDCPPPSMDLCSDIITDAQSGHCCPGTTVAAAAAAVGAHCTAPADICQPTNQFTS